MSEYLLEEAAVNELELKDRTKRFVLRVMKLVSVLPRAVESRTIAQQLMDSASSVGANYRSACRGRSKAEFISKLGIVEEEADESAFWLELIIEGGLMTKELVQPLWQVANELTSIMVASRRTAKGV